MTYLALARKWRPRTFSELLGQEHLVRALSQSLTQNRVHHAYLFTGTRGVGKTSIARILAKALNCIHGDSAQPCLSCENCQAIEQGRFIDLIEIDAASKTRVEDTRELLDNVQYAPTIGRYKIYLIDEVHMLSQHSFNALLKTLEEPPSHVKFLLATTDAQKLPITILSRCIQFHLKPVTAPIITSHLQTILQAETVSFEPQALAMIAKAARGSMRDALSLLDQCLSGHSGNLNADNVSQLLGQSTEDFAIQLLQALCAHDPQQLITISRKISGSGGQFRYVLDEILAYLHRIAIVQALPHAPELIESQPEIILFSQQLSAEDTQLFYQIGLKGLHDLPYAPTANIGFEMILLRMYTFKPANSVILPKLAYQQPPRQHLVAATKEAPLAEPAHPQQPIPDLLSSPEMTIPSADSAPIPHVSAATPPSNNPVDWATVVAQLKLSGLAHTAIQHSELLEKISGQLVLKVSHSHESIFTPAVISRIQESLCAFYQEPIQLNLHYHSKISDSPAAQKISAETQQQESYRQALLNDPVFQQLQQEFAASLIQDSVSSV